MVERLSTSYRNIDNSMVVGTLYCCETEESYLDPNEMARVKVTSIAAFSDVGNRNYFFAHPTEFHVSKTLHPHTRLCYLSEPGGTLYDLECEDNPRSIISTLSLLLLDLNPNSKTQRKLAKHLAYYVHSNKHKLNPKDVAPAIRALSDVKYLVDEEHNKRLRSLQELKQEDFKYYNRHYRSILESVCFTAGG